MARKDFEIVVDKRSMRRLFKGLNVYDKQVQGAINIEFRASALDILAKSQRNLQKNDSIASGKLAQSGRFRQDKGRLFVDVVYTGYAGAIEFGRKAGKFPPVDVIRQWVKRKLRISNEKENKSVAFLIARSIAKNGTKAKPFLQPAYNETVKGLRNRIITAINKITDKAN